MAVEVMRLRPFGINTDLPDQVVAPNMFTYGYNIIFEDERIRPTNGYSSTPEPPLFTPVVMKFVTINNVDWWVYAGQDGVGAWNGVNHVDITPIGYNPPSDQIFMTVISNFPVLSWVGMPEGYWWDGNTGAPMQILPGWPAPSSTEGPIVANQFHLFCLRHTDGGGNYNGQRVRWSDLAQNGQVPQEWAVLPENQAGFVDLVTPEGQIVGGAPLNERFMVYKENSTHALTFIGGVYIYQLQTVFESIGLLAANAVVELDNFHVMVTQDDIIMHDGNNVQSIADKTVKHDFFRNLSSDYAHRTFLHLDRNNEQIYLGFPSLESSGACDAMFIYHFVDKTWTVRTFPSEFYCADDGSYVVPELAAASWDGDWGGLTWDQWQGRWNFSTESATKNQHVIGAAGPALWRLGNFRTDDGVEISCSVSKTGIDLGEIDSYKLLTRVWPRFYEGLGQQVEIRLGMADSPESPPMYTPWQTFTIGTDITVPVIPKAGRAMAFEVRDEAVGAEWSLVGFDVEFRRQGRF